MSRGGRSQAGRAGAVASKTFGDGGPNGKARPTVAQATEAHLAALGDRDNAKAKLEGLRATLRGGDLSISQQAIEEAKRQVEYLDDVCEGTEANVAAAKRAAVVEASDVLWEDTQRIYADGLGAIKSTRDRLLAALEEFVVATTSFHARVAPLRARFADLAPPTPGADGRFGQPYLDRFIAGGRFGALAGIASPVTAFDWPPAIVGLLIRGVLDLAPPGSITPVWRSTLQSLSRDDFKVESSKLSRLLEHVDGGDDKVSERVGEMVADLAKSAQVVTVIEPAFAAPGGGLTQDPDDDS